jgi:Tfp pilus assembly protein FimV
MALRIEELESQGARVYAFPTARVRARARARVRRRRAGGATVVIAVVAMTLMGTGTAPASKSSAPRAVVVRAGETLWDVAERYAPAGLDPRAYVDAVVELNDLGGRMPAAGERIRLPK